MGNIRYSLGETDASEHHGEFMEVIMKGNSFFYFSKHISEIAAQSKRFGAEHVYVPMRAKQVPMHSANVFEIRCVCVCVCSSSCVPIGLKLFLCIPIARCHILI